MALTDKGYEELSFTCTESNLSYEANYADSNLNFFGVSSGLVYERLNTTTFEKR